jgi:hypothetical protein
MCVIVSSSRSSFVSSSLGVVKSVTEIFFTLISAFFHKVFFNALSLSLSLSLSLHTYTPNARRRGDDDERAIIRRETRGLK